VGGLVGLLVVERGSELSTYWWPLMLLGTGVGLSATPVTIMLLAATPTDLSGTASALGYTLRQVGGVFGVAVAGTIVQQRLRDRLPAALSDVPLPRDTADQVVDRVSHGDVSVLREVPSALARILSSRTGDEFVNATHVAYLAGAGGCLLAAVSCVVLL